MPKKKYDVVYTTDALAHICVEAKNEDEAVRLASEQKRNLTWQDFKINDNFYPTFCDIKELDK